MQDGSISKSMEQLPISKRQRRHIKFLCGDVHGKPPRFLFGRPRQSWGNATGRHPHGDAALWPVLTLGQSVSKQAQENAKAPAQHPPMCRRFIMCVCKIVCCTTVFFFCRRAADKVLYYPNSRVDTGSFQAAESSLRFATA